MPRAFLLSAFFVCMISFPIRGKSQQSSPLLGLGTDPVSAHATGQAVPVYISVLLHKVLSVDAVLYRFEAVMDILMTWHDPRAPAAEVYILGGGNNYTATYEAAMAACYKAYLEHSIAGYDLCKAASIVAHPDSCSKLCGLATPHYCCDGIWLPDLTLPAAVFFSQDRAFDEQILIYHNDSVGRRVRVEGVFTNSFNFHKFPFDRQVLTVPIHSNGDPSSYYLVPSYVGKVAPGVFSGLDTEAASEEITGWTIHNISLSCDSLHAAQQTYEKGLLTWQTPNKDDPAYLASPPGPPTPLLPSNHSVTCSLHISISRDSSYYIWIDVVPVILATTGSFAVFATGPTALDVRLSTVVTLFLAIVALQFVVIDGLPKTTYLTKFGTLTIASYTVFSGIILEAAVVYVLANTWTFREAKGKLSRTDKPRGGRVRWTSSEEEDRMAVHRLEEEEEDEDDCKEGREGQEARLERSLQADDAADSSDGAPPDAPPLGSRVPRPKRSNPMGKLGRALSLGEPALRSMRESMRGFAADPHKGYRIASTIDLVCGPTLLLGYVIAVCIILLV